MPRAIALFSVLLSPLAIGINAFLRLTFTFFKSKNPAQLRLCKMWAKRLLKNTSFSLIPSKINESELATYGIIILCLRGSFKDEHKWTHSVYIIY